jgi:hypothetical protein
MAAPPMAQKGYPAAPRAAVVKTATAFFAIPSLNEAGARRSPVGGALSSGWGMSAIPPLSGDQQTSGEPAKIDAIDPEPTISRLRSASDPSAQHSRHAPLRALGNFWWTARLIHTVEIHSHAQSRKNPS